MARPAKTETPIADPAPEATKPEKPRKVKLDKQTAALRQIIKARCDLEVARVRATYTRMMADLNEGKDVESRIFGNATPRVNPAPAAQPSSDPRFVDPPRGDDRKVGSIAGPPQPSRPNGLAIQPYSPGDPPPDPFRDPNAREVPMVNDRGQTVMMKVKM